MKILYDHQIFERHQVGGISRYFADLLAHCTAAGSAQWEIAVRYSDNEYLRQLLPAGQVRGIRRDFQDFCRGLQFRGKRRLYDAWYRVFPERHWAAVNRRAALERIRAGEFDLFHPTYYDPYFLDAIGTKPFVLTIHDMIPELYCEYYPLDDPTPAWKRALIKRAAGIIAVSENTRRDLIEILGVPPELISVIHHGTTHAGPAPQGHAPKGGQAPDGRASLPEGLPGRYLLFVGTRGRYKNLYFFLLALTGLFEAEKDLQIICTGQPFDREELHFFRSLGLQERVQYRYVGEEDLPAVYRKAVAMVFPSLYEGFGFPLLEAFAAGCPVIVSRTSSLPEVGGEAVVYVDPKSAASIREAVTRVLQDDGLRRTLAERGLERVRCFTVAGMAEKTLQFYREVLERCAVRKAF